MDETKAPNFYINLPEYLQYFLMKADLMLPREILLENNSTFQNLGASEKVIELLKLEAAKFLNLNFMCVRTLINDNPENWSEKLSFGCKSINNCTKGGIIKRGITEIFGESGSGKTHIVLQLCLMIQLPHKFGGFSKKAAFINTGKIFPLKRLSQLTEHFQSKYHEDINFFDGIFVKNIYDSAELTKCIQTQLIDLIKKQNIGLIVIDSIASIYRTELDYIKRAKDMRRLVYNLLNIVEKHKCFVICVNQVSSVENTFVPSLGLAWSHLIRTRFQVSKTENDLFHKNRRRFDIIFSPELPNKFCEFMITSKGIVDF